MLVLEESRSSDPLQLWLFTLTQMLAEESCLFGANPMPGERPGPSERSGVAAGLLVWLCLVSHLSGFRLVPSGLWILSPCFSLAPSLHLSLAVALELQD